MKCERCAQPIPTATAVWLSLDFDRGTWAPALDRDREFTFAFDRDCADRALAGDW